jgi:hypothetical protein
VFENRVLRKIYEHKREEVTGGWLEEMKTIICMPDQILFV